MLHRSAHMAGLLLKEKEQKNQYNFALFTTDNFLKENPQNNF